MLLSGARSSSKLALIASCDRETVAFGRHADEDRSGDSVWAGAGGAQLE